MSFFFFTTIPCLCPCHFDQFRFTGSPIKHFKCSHHHLFASRDHLSCSNHISGSHFLFLKQQIKPIWFLKIVFSTFFQVSFDIVVLSCLMVLLLLLLCFQRQCMTCNCWVTRLAACQRLHDACYNQINIFSSFQKKNSQISSTRIQKAQINIFCSVLKKEFQ